MRTLLLLPFIAACATTTTQAPAPSSVATPDVVPPVIEEALATPSQDVMLELALQHPARTEADVARDSERHPAQTLAFFGVKPTDHVLELWAGGGWYSRVLAPYLASGGHLHVTQYAQDAEPSYRATHAVRWQEYQTEQGFGQSTSTITLTSEDPQLGLTEAVDVVLTFRNVHNWAKADIDTSIYAQSFAALKPGGTFGIVDHSGPGVTREQSADSGYMDPQAVIDAVTAVGFVFEEASDINANPLDTFDHPEGVWTLPPSFELEDVDRDKYAAIGESNRMTLRFRKPIDVVPPTE
jgi:predicted methyltransferase